jgi:DNA polymerase-3 subunit gamma/tau
MAALQQIAVAQLVGDRSSGDGDSEWQALATTIDPEDVQLYYQIAVSGRRDIAWCRDERMSFEMTLLRMLAFRPGAPDGKSSERRAASGSAPAPRARTETRTRTRTRTVADPRPAAKTVDGGASTTRADGGEAPIADWSALVRAAGLRGAVRNLADHSELESNVGGRLELVLAADKANFNTDQLRRRLEQRLGEHLNREIRVNIKLGTPPRATPAEVRRANEDERMRETREAIEQDPNIQAVQAAFDAVLEPDSIQPTQTKG